MGFLNRFFEAKTQPLQAEVVGLGMASAKRQKGFTLLELGFVVGLMTILAGGFVVYQSSNNAKATRAHTDMTILKDAVLRFQADTGMNPGSVNHLWDRRAVSGLSALAYTRWDGPYMKQMPVTVHSESEGDQDYFIDMQGIDLFSRMQLVHVVDNGGMVWNPDFTSGSYQSQYDYVEGYVNIFNKSPLAIKLTHVPYGIARLLVQKCGGGLSNDANRDLNLLARGDYSCVAIDQDPPLVSGPTPPRIYDIYMSINHVFQE